MTFFFKTNYLNSLPTMSAHCWMWSSVFPFPCVKAESDWMGRRDAPALQGSSTPLGVFLLPWFIICISHV